MTNATNTQEAIWSGTFTPSMHQRVKVKVNNLGTGRISGFFSEHGFMGVIVDLDNPPQWHLRQIPEGDPYHKKAHVFGIEIESLDQ